MADRLGGADPRKSPIMQIHLDQLDNINSRLDSAIERFNILVDRAVGSAPQRDAPDRLLRTTAPSSPVIANMLDERTGLISIRVDTIFNLLDRLEGFI